MIIWKVSSMNIAIPNIVKPIPKWLGVLVLTTVLLPVGFYFGQKVATVKSAGVEAAPSPSATMEEKYILALSPKSKNAEELGNHLKFVSETFAVDSKLLIAIAFQESSFKTDAVNNNDLGLFQLNYGHQITGKNRPYTIEEITRDWKLNSILAAQYIRECSAVKRDTKTKLEPWTCYHSFTYEKALIYQSLVLKHLHKLERLENKK